MSNSNSSSYLKYALGEIILVVIGILIAVALNNWNEERKQRVEIQNVHQLVKENLQADIEAIDVILETYDKTEFIYKKYLNNEIVAKDFSEIQILPYFILGYPQLKLNQRGYQLLQKFSDSLDKTDDQLTTDIISFYVEMLHEVKVDDTYRADNFEENLNHWKTYEWWPEYITRKDFKDFIEYAMNDADYRNRVASAYFINFSVFKPEIEEYKEKAKKLIEQID